MSRTALEGGEASLVGSLGDRTAPRSADLGPGVGADLQRPHPLKRAASSDDWKQKHIRLLELLVVLAILVVLVVVVVVVGGSDAQAR